MFGGVISAVGIVRSHEHGRLMIAESSVAKQVRVGSSVAVQGVCLTVTSVRRGAMTFDVVPESYKRSTLGSVNIGDRVHLEPALRVGDPVDGHFLLGHVDGVGQVISLKKLPDGSAWLQVRPPSKLLRAFPEKGSVGIDGISLTVARRDATTFAVALVPHTLAVTTLAELIPGAKLNLEIDVFARYASLSTYGSRSTKTTRLPTKKKSRTRR